MFIILSQRIDLLSEYSDKPYEIYHYPKIYKNQIKSGDIFVYYQGDSKDRNNRYYYGCGVIGDITVTEDGNDYYAEILKGIEFPRKVSIYNPNGKFYETLGRSADQNLNPAWQRSIRKLTKEAFEVLLQNGNLDPLIIKELLTLKYEQKIIKDELKKLKIYLQQE